MAKHQKEFRGWVMVVRDRAHPTDRDHDGYLAGQRIREELAGREPEFFRRVIEVYGDYDVVVQVEHDSLEGLHGLVMRLGAVQGVRSTATLIAAKKGMPVNNSHAHQSVLRLRTLSGQQEAVQQELLKIPGVDGADVVFGDYDVLAVVNQHHRSVAATLKQIVAAIKDITRSATLLHYPPEEPAESGSVSNLEAENRRLQAQINRMRQAWPSGAGEPPAEMGGEG